MATTEDQIAAWETYRLAKIKADKTLDFKDGRAAAIAWSTFSQMFAGERQTAAIDAPPSRNVAIFPVHRTRMPGARAD